jgi:dTDP-glucose 4,6-dehydratase
MKRVLITGLGGNIGVHVMAHIFTNTDWEIVGLDSYRHKGLRDRVKTFLTTHPEWKDRLTDIQCDLVCPVSDALKKQIGDINYIIHLAAISDVQYSVENSRYTIYNNVETTMTMLEYAKDTPHEAFIYFSTDEIYGPISKDGEPHKEWDVMRPSSAYAASKGMGELAAYAYWRSGWVKLIITNTMNNLGEGQGASKFPALVQHLLSQDKEVTIHGNENELGSRVYIHSRNAADALLFILQHTKPYEHQVGNSDDWPDKYHVVGDRKLNNLELAQMIAKYMKKDLKYKIVDFHKDNPAHDIHYGMVDTKLRKMGWKPPVELEEGIKNIVKWNNEHPDWLE